MKTNIDKLAKLLGRTKDEAIALYTEICANVTGRPSTYDVFQFFNDALSQSAEVKVGAREAIDFFQNFQQRDEERKVAEAKRKELEKLYAEAQKRELEIQRHAEAERIRNEVAEQTRRHEEAVRQAEEQNKAAEQAFLAQYGVRYLYHMVKLANLESILQHGLLCHNLAHKRGLVRADISMPEVQERRAGKTISFDDAHVIELHDFVNFYLQPRNPMLYKRKAEQNTIVILAFDPILLSRKYSLVSDGNAANGPTKFYVGCNGLAKVRWDILQARYWTGYEDGVRIRCAEALILEQVETSYLRAVFCFNQEQIAKVASLLTHRPDIIIQLDNTIYFRD